MTKQIDKRNNKGSKYVGVFPLEFSEGKPSTDGGVAIPDTIHLIPIGTWEHDLYGPIIITFSDIREFAQNFNAGIRKGVPITAGHEGYEELPAVGWVSAVEAREDGLWGEIEWNNLGKGTLTDKQFKFFSPEFNRDYEDPETHQLYRNVLVGGALTKSPYFKGLEAIVFSENKLKFNTTMNLQELLAKSIETLTEEEKAFIKAHASELTDEQKVTHTAIIDEASVETEEEKAARETKEAEEKAAADAKAIGDANEAAGLNRDGSAKADGATVEASDKKLVTISASELEILRTKADQGVQAFRELEAEKINSAIKTLTFSESNKMGKFLPKSVDSLRKFMESLNATQRQAFSTLIAELPETQIFKENGASSATDGTATAEVEAKVTAKMSANKDLKYSEALRQVFSENKGLEERYDGELPSARKQ